jgi:hypothetical protein
LNNIETWVTAGEASFNSPSHLPPTEASKVENPVRVSPGRPKSCTKPEPFGSVTSTKTIGTPLFLKAAVVGVESRRSRSQQRSLDRVRRLANDNRDLCYRPVSSPIRSGPLQGRQPLRVRQDRLKKVRPSAPRRAAFARVLRTCDERPCGRRTGNSLNEIAPSHRPSQGLGPRRFSKWHYSRDLRPAEWGSGVSLHGSNPDLLMSALGQKRT